MKNKRELIIAGIFLLIGIAVSQFLIQTRIPINKQTAQSPKKIAENTAITIVRNLPEVKDFLNGIQQADQKVVAHEATSVWNIQVAQVATATYPFLRTFNWYMLDVNTGKVKCSFAIYDQYGKYVRNSDEYPCNEQPTLTPTQLNPSLKTAIELIKQKGYTVFDPSEIWYIPSGLNAFIGMCSGSADGYCNKAFFFYNGKYLGTDTSDESIDVGIKWTAGDTIALQYTLYHKDDPLCCSTAGAALVRYHWDGTKLKALDPIPTSDWFADVHR